MPARLSQKLARGWTILARTLLATLLLAQLTALWVVAHTSPTRLPVGVIDAFAELTSDRIDFECREVTVDSRGRIRLAGVRGAKRRLVVDAGLVVQPVDRLVQEDHGELRAGQGRVELDAATLQIGLAEHAQARRGLDRQLAHGPARLPDDEALRGAAAAPNVRADRPQQCPGQGGVATGELRQAAGERVRQVLLGAVDDQRGLRVVHQAHQRVHEGAQPLNGVEPLAQQDASVGEVEAGVPTTHRHLLGRELADDQGVRAQLEALGKREIA